MISQNNPNGHWVFPEELEPKKFIGFVYLTIDPLFGDFYIGKKNYRRANGLESDWKSYVTSSKIMQALIKEGSIANFEFHVLEQYYAKGMLTYAETWSLCKVEAPTRKDCHSKRIERIQWKVSEKITERHKERLAALVK